MRRCRVQFGTQNGVSINVNNVTLEYVQIKNVHQDLLTLGSHTDTGFRLNGIDTFYRCEFSDPNFYSSVADGDCFQVFSPTNVFNSRLRVQECYMRQDTDNKQAILTRGAQGSQIFINNYIEGERGVFAMAGIYGNVVVQGNTFDLRGRSALAGIRWLNTVTFAQEAGARSVFRGNLFKGTGIAGIMSLQETIDPMTFDGTVNFDNNWIECQIFDDLSWSSYIGMDSANNSVTLLPGFRLNVRNNFFVGELNGAPAVVLPATGAPDARLVFQNNFFIPGATFEVLGGATYADIAAFQAAMPTATLNQNQSDSTLLLNPDYTPKDTSPAKWAGIFTEQCKDGVGRIRNNPPSIGPVEYVRSKTARS
jgi:hypothetical protein